jgi:VWFA-related protein
MWGATRVGWGGCALLGLRFWATGPQAPQSEPRPAFPAGTELVTVDVVILDRHGAPLSGLRREDFSVAEEGVPQPIVAFEAVERPIPKTAETPQRAPRPHTSSNVGAEARQGRSFVVVFDGLHLDAAEAKRARAAVADFLKTGLGDSDRVTLVGTGEGTWWTGRLPEGRDALVQVLGRLQGRRVGESTIDAVTDYEAMRIDRDADPIVTDRVARRFIATGMIRQQQRLPGDPPNQGEELEAQRGQVRARAAQVWARAASQNAATLAALERALQSLASVRGRKTLILVSGGFVHDPHEEAFRRVVTESRRANAAIYFLDARGLTGAPTAFQADSGVQTDVNDLGSVLDEARERSEGSEGLATDTGGFSVRNDNDLRTGIERIGRESASYYLLGYSPSDKRPDGRFRKIEVKVAREGVTVRARRGYYALGPATVGGAAKAEARDAALQRALDSPFDLAEIPLRATAHVFGEATPGKARVLVTLEADIRSLSFEESGSAAKDTLELLLLVVHRETGEFDRFDQQFEMAFGKETRARFEKAWFPITREVALPPGTHQARIVVRDKNSGRVGSLVHEFEVPALTGLRISTPILSDHLREEGKDAGRVPELTARRVFAASGILHCRFEVFGAAGDPKTGVRAVTAGFAVRRSDGRLLAAAPETPLKPAADGTLERTQGTPLGGAPPGHYELILVVTDLVAGQAAETREAFEIEEANGG